MEILLPKLIYLFTLFTGLSTDVYSDQIAIEINKKKGKIELQGLFVENEDAISKTERERIFSYKIKSLVDGVYVKSKKMTKQGGKFTATFKFKIEDKEAFYQALDFRMTNEMIKSATEEELQEKPDFINANEMICALPNYFLKKKPITNGKLFEPAREKVYIISWPEKSKKINLLMEVDSPEGADYIEK